MITPNLNVEFIFVLRLREIQVIVEGKKNSERHTMVISNRVG